MFELWEYILMVTTLVVIFFLFFRVDLKVRWTPKKKDKDGRWTIKK